MSGLVGVRTGWRLGTLLRGEPESLRDWIERWDAAGLARSAFMILAGAGLYGGAMGCWRALLAGGALPTPLGGLGDTIWQRAGGRFLVQIGQECGVEAVHGSG